MPWGLSNYSLSNFQEGNRDLSVNIKKVENGFLVRLSGYKKIKDHDEKGKEFHRWENIDVYFVYNKLTDAVKEVEEFFNLLDKWSKDENKKGEK